MSIELSRVKKKEIKLDGSPQSLRNHSATELGAEPVEVKVPFGNYQNLEQSPPTQAKKHIKRRLWQKNNE